MIYTQETLGNPVEFIAANPDIVSSMPENGWQIVSGVDKDVLIRESEFSSHWRENAQTSKILGPLYTEGAAYGVELNGRTWVFRWFPSPTANNQLLEELGYTPGHDAFKFVHAHGYDAVPALPYTTHVSHGEFPQSVGTIYFEHDRNYDHTPAVFLGPTDFFDRATHQAQRVLPKSKGRRSLFTGDFDKATSLVRKITHDLVDDVQAGELGNSDQYSRLTTSQFLIDNKDRVTQLGRAKYQQVMEHYFAHLCELFPKIEKLQIEKFGQATLRLAA